MNHRSLLIDDRDGGLRGRLGLACPEADGHWEEFVLPSPIPITVSAYWIAVHSDADLDSRDSDGADQDLARRLIAQSYASGLPDPFGTGSSYSNTRGLKITVWTNP